MYAINGTLNGKPMQIQPH